MDGVHSREVDKLLSEEGEQDLLPGVLEDKWVVLAKVGIFEFKREQKNEEDREKTKKSHFEYKESLIIRKTHDHRGNDRIQLLYR